MLLVRETLALAWSMVRPLVVLDFESDGPGEADPALDRIIQIGFLRIEPNGDAGSRVRTLNPGPGFLPLKRTDIHHVTDLRIAEAPLFGSMARSFHESIVGCDLMTYNGANYDLPLLWEEFYRAGITWDVDQHAHIDVSIFWRKYEPRSLSDAFKRFTGKEPPENMHDAGADVRCTCETLSGMINTFVPGFVPSVEDLANETRPTSKIGGQELPRIDLAGVLVRDANGDAIYTHKKQKGVRLKDDPGYAEWILSKDFSQNTKLAIRIEFQRIQDECSKQQKLAL